MYQLEDRPSKVGLEAQHHLQLKTSWISQSNGMDFDSRPTGYVNPLRQYVNTLKEKLSHIPQIRWKCPPKFALDYKWRVAAGEESKEAEAQKHREMRVYEAVYPCLSAIPPSPSISLGVEACNHDDSNIPLISITSIEEETAADLPSDMAAPLNTSVALDLPQCNPEHFLNTPQCSVAAPLNASVALDLPQGSLTLGYLNTPQCNPPVSLKPPALGTPECSVVLPLNTSVALDLPQGLLTSGSLNTPQCNPPVFLNPPANEKPALETSPGMEGDVVVAAAAALAAIIKCKEQGSLIDTDLLIQFLSNPKMIEKLINENGATGYTGSEPVSVPKLEKFVDEHGATANTGSEPASVPKPLSPSVPVPSSKLDMVMKKYINEHGALAKPVTVPISGLKTVTPLVPFLSLKPEDQIKKLSNQYRSPASIATTPSSWSPSVPFLSSKPDDMIIKNWSNEHGALAHIGTKHIAGSEPVVLSPNSKSEMVMVKRLINEYGAPSTINETMPRSNLLFTPKPDMVKFPSPSLHPTENVLQSRLHMRSSSPDIIHKPPFSAQTAPPVKDINYYKNLIKQHGEGKESLDHNLSQFGKLHNHIRGPELVHNLKSSESKPKNQKPCMYFNSSKGCRNGSNCPYKHSMSDRLRPGGVLEAPSAKRMKLSGVISGKT